MFEQQAAAYAKEKSRGEQRENKLLYDAVIYGTSLVPQAAPTAPQLPYFKVNGQVIEFEEMISRSGGELKTDEAGRQFVEVRPDEEDEEDEKGESVYIPDIPAQIQTEGEEVNTGTVTDPIQTPVTENTLEQSPEVAEPSADVPHETEKTGEQEPLE